MGDSGEGLVDASSRLQERMEEIQDSRRRSQRADLRPDPDLVREFESLRLARLDLERQLSATAHEARRLHLVNALAEIDRRRSELQTAAK
jgi:ABC-type phosphate transport system auxiliary subunit